tara:strand:- start:221 stop:502 length:282 start_codon:yes stop_codon:yes gene_type:complete
MSDYDPLVANRKTTVGRLRYLAEIIAVPEARSMLNSAANATEELIKSVELLVQLVEERDSMINIALKFGPPAAVSATKSALANIKHSVKEDTQ